MKMINEKKLKNKLVTMLREDWNGKKGYLTDNEMFKYCQFYTGDFWKKSEKTTETPGCSLCMGNQARVKDNATVVSTSTRNFPNRLGDDADVYLSSAEVANYSFKIVSSAMCPTDF
jgi:aconitase B